MPKGEFGEMILLIYLAFHKVEILTQVLKQLTPFDDFVMNNEQTCDCLKYRTEITIKKI
jgi:hypothetical protein